MKFYWGSDIEVTEGVRGFAGDRNFRVKVEADVHSDDEDLQVTLVMGEGELRELLKRIENVLEEGV